MHAASFFSCPTQQLCFRCNPYLSAIKPRLHLVLYVPTAQWRNHLDLLVWDQDMTCTTCTITWLVTATQQQNELIISAMLNLLLFFLDADLPLWVSDNGRCNESSINYNIVFKEGHHAGTFQKETDITDMVSCIDKCCQTQDCDVAFMSQENCYLVDCYSLDKCATKHLKRPKYETMLSFVARSRRNRPSKI